MLSGREVIKKIWLFFKSLALGIPNPFSNVIFKSFIISLLIIPIVLWPFVVLLAIFPENKFDLKRIINHLRQQAYLTRGVRIGVLDHRTPEHQNYTFYFEGGLRSYVKYLVGSANLVHSNIFYAYRIFIFISAKDNFYPNRGCRR